MRRNRILGALMLSCVLSACSHERIAQFAPAPSSKPAPYVQYGASAGLGGAGGHTVLSGDTVYTIAKQYKLALRDIIDANDLTAPYKLAPGTRVQLPPPQTYKVRKGDSLPVVSRIFAVAQTDIIALNNLSSPYRLVAGTDIRLPRANAVTPAPMRFVPLLADQPKIVYRPYPKSAGQNPVINNGTVASAPEAVMVERLPDVTATPLPPVAGTMPPQPTTATTAGDIRPPMPSKPSTQQAVFQHLPDVPARSNGRFLKPVNGQLLSRYGTKPDGLYNEGVNIAAPRGTPVRAAENGVVVYVGNGVEGYGNLVLVKHADGYITAYAHLEKTLAREGAKVTRGQTIGTVGSSGNVDRAQLHFEVRKGRDSVDPLTVI